MGVILDAERRGSLVELRRVLEKVGSGLAGTAMNDVAFLKGYVEGRISALEGKVGTFEFEFELSCGDCGRPLDYPGEVHDCFGEDPAPNISTTWSDCGCEVEAHSWGECMKGDSNMEKDTP